MAKYKIPTWNAGVWEYTIFPDRNTFREFVKSLFKEPGLYNFDKISIPGNTTEQFNHQARNFKKNKMFCEAPEGSRDFQEYWDTEKEKCRKGVIFNNGKGGIWYLPRFYYHWLNFLQIYDKRPEVKDFVFPEVRDVQYHMALYEILAELFDKNSAILKSRQKASSYFHICKLYNKYIFERGYVGRIGASDKKYINKTKGSWKFLNQYHNFTNTHTAWTCANNPDKEFEWEQKVETKTSDGRKIQMGTGATITGVSFDTDPVGGVGGAIDEFFYEEGGIAPTADKTYAYIQEAMREGAITTGIFSIAGSVGALDQCGPLKKFVLNPIDYDFYPVWSNLLDENGTEGWTALFIPEQWGMVPFIDESGNSMVKEALDYLNNIYEDLKKNKGSTSAGAEDYQIRISQRPRNIKEAFDIRTVSIFQAKYTTRQAYRIEKEGSDVYLKYVDLERNDENVIIAKQSERQPCPYPMSMKEQDKRGCIVIHQHPGLNPEWGTHYFSVDPVESGTSHTSDSLAAVYIYMNPIEVTKIDDEGESTTFIEGDKLVAEWVGRYDDVNETNENISKLVEYYNAWGISENNKPSFNTYMILKKRTRHLAMSSEMLFDKELQVSQNVHDKYGWKKTTGLWNKIIQYAVDYIGEELGEEKDNSGKVIRIKYGIERIPFIWLIKEMQSYNEKSNFDRIIAYAALIAFAKIQQAAGNVKKRIERKETKPKQIHNFETVSMFKSIGQGGGMTRGRGIGFRSIGRRQT